MKLAYFLCAARVCEGIFAAATVLLICSSNGGDKGSYYGFAEVPGLILALLTSMLTLCWIMVDGLLDCYVDLYPYRYCVCQGCINGILAILSFVAASISVVQLTEIKDNSHLANSSLLSNSPNWLSYTIVLGLLVGIFFLLCCKLIAQVATHEAGESGEIPWTSARIGESPERCGRSATQKVLQAHKYSHVHTCDVKLDIESEAVV